MLNPEDNPLREVPEVDTHPALVRALDMLLDVVCVVDGEGRFVALSAACEQVFGYTPEELIGKPFLDLVLSEDRPRTIAAASGVMSGIPLRNFENRYIRKDGRVVDIMWTARWSEADQLRLAVAREVTDRKRQEALQAALYDISEAAHSAASLHDLCRRIHEIIGGMLPIPNFCVALYDTLGGELSFPYVQDERHATFATTRLDPATPLGAVVQGGKALLLSAQKQRGHWRAGPAYVGETVLDWLGVPLIADQQTMGAVVVQSYDPELRYGEEHLALLQFVSAQIAANIQRQQANARIQYMAQYDMLTGLPNRMLFDDRLLVLLTRAARDKRPVAVLYIDLDNFKPVNDNYGHAAGDLLLQEIARRIQACVRESDTVSRIGGDEFVVLLGALLAPENALVVAEEICRAIQLPYALPRQSLQISASVGIAIHPEHGNNANQLVRYADTAMYAAKRLGGNRCHLFFERMLTGGLGEGL